MRSNPISPVAWHIAGQKVVVVSSVEKDTGLVQVMPLAAFTNRGGVSVTMTFSDLVALS